MHLHNPKAVSVGSRHKIAHDGILCKPPYRVASDDWSLANKSEFGIVFGGLERLENHDICQHSVRWVYHVTTGQGASAVPFPL